LTPDRVKEALTREANGEARVFSLEPLSFSSMQCPGCNVPLEPEIVGGQPFERCRRCGGEYFSHQALEELLAAHAGQSGANGAGYRRPSPFSDPVRYRKCPSCREPMLRRNFRESSGVVVDVCAAHGVWLDQGELASLIEFAASGAMAEAERRSGERGDARKRLDAWSEDLRALGPRHDVHGFSAR
jgi:Zn-finger nucleic acid-binding protein